MSYQRILTPRIYVDNINYAFLRGKMSTSDITSSLLGFNTGSSLLGMFDLRPTNVQSLNEGGGNDDFYIEIDSNFSTDANVDNNFIAILGHNMHSANAEFRIKTDDASDFGSAQSPAMTEVVNCGGDVSSGSSNYANPASNGWSLATFTQTSDNRYMRIYFQAGASGNYAADTQIGAILVGEYFDLSHSPNLSIKKSYEFDGVKKLQSLGGQTYSNANFLHAGDWAVKSAFYNSTSTTANPAKFGRINLDMAFSFMADTDVYPDKHYDPSQIIQTNNVVNNLIIKTASGHLPFLFQFDKDTATADDSFLWCRLNKDMAFTQVAHQYWNTTMSLREEF